MASPTPTTLSRIASPKPMPWSSCNESGYADQNDLARAFGYSTRTLRRFQERLHRGGLNALIRPQGQPAEDSISHIAPRDRIILRLKAQGLSNRGIAGRDRKSVV